MMTERNKRVVRRRVASYFDFRIPTYRIPRIRPSESMRGL